MQNETTELSRQDHSTDKRVILAVVGDKGAIHYWNEESTMPYLGSRYFGGVEMHSRTKLDYSQDEPDQPDCWLLKGPCWHDGSSLWADETMTPLWEHCRDFGDMEPLWRELESIYRKQFKSADA